MGYKMELTGIESLLTAVVLLCLPFIILAVLVQILPTRSMAERPTGAP
jgi:hypothetical protein